jgi:hypothetical protein
MPNNEKFLSHIENFGKICFTLILKIIEINEQNLVIVQLYFCDAMAKENKINSLIFS